MLGSGTKPDLRSLAIESLQASPIFHGRLALGAIRVDSDGATLVLSGSLPSFYLKQLLQETLKRLTGVVSVQNRVIVDDK